jgi:excisionase family DNA binding protein
VSDGTDQKLFDVQGAAKYLQSIGATGAAVYFIRSIITRGEIPFVRIGKKFFLTRESLDRWLETHERRMR